MLIKKMPDKETLEAYLEGLHGNVIVYFDTEKGEFIWCDKRYDRKLTKRDNSSKK